MGQQLENCQAAKKKVHGDLGKKRKALSNALIQLFLADCEYSNTYCEHEALRIQTDNLKQRGAQVGEHNSAAELAAQTAVDACRQWQKNALESERQLRDRIQAEVESCQSLMMLPTRA